MPKLRHLPSCRWIAYAGRHPAAGPIAAGRGVDACMTWYAICMMETCSTNQKPPDLTAVCLLLVQLVADACGACLTKCMCDTGGRQMQHMLMLPAANNCMQHTDESKLWLTHGMHASALLAASLPVSACLDQHHPRHGRQPAWHRHAGACIAHSVAQWQHAP